MFKRNPQLNKFNRAQNRSVDKKEGLLHLADRAIMAEGWCWDGERIDALAEGKHCHSIGMPTYLKAIEACVIKA